MSEGLGIEGIAQVAIAVKDLDRAIAFYRDVLGLPFLFTAPPGLAFLQCDRTRIMLANDEASGGVSSCVLLYFRVPDVRKTAVTLADRGIPLDSEPRVIASLAHEDVWLAFVKDPEGNLVGLMSELPR